MGYGVIYEILNTKNSKSYRGATVDAKQRWYEHAGMLRKGTHFNRKLQNAWNKYGEDCFHFHIIALAENETQLSNLEESLVLTSHSYNIKNGGCHARCAVETKAKISLANCGRKNGMFGKIAWNKGKPGLQIAWNKGRTLSSEHRANIIAAMPQGHYERLAALFSGKPLSLEHRSKLSAALKGKPWSSARRAAQEVRES